jgi:hypothetical protein
VDDNPVFPLGLYLAPEGVTVPEDPAREGQTFDSPESIAEQFGLSELANYKLGSLVDRKDLDNGANTLAEPRVVTSDALISIPDTFLQEPQLGRPRFVFLKLLRGNNSPFENITNFSIS